MVNAVQYNLSLGPIQKSNANWLLFSYRPSAPSSRISMNEVIELMIDGLDK
jgi:hypothetical protein